MAVEDSERRPGLVLGGLGGLGGIRGLGRLARRGRNAAGCEPPPYG
ncbi:MAG TPA: hypothetical protein VKG80_18715 [Trebonia sp.]|nr:hypothetical protein [Trebonia sp.]